MSSTMLSFFDANCYLGHTSAPQPGAYTTAAGMLAVMEEYRLAEALPYSPTAAGYDYAYDNRTLGEAVASEPRLHPCFVVAPHHTGELPEAPTLVAEMLAAGARAARLYPDRIGPLRPWLYAPLLAALAERSLPLFVDFELGHYSQHLQGIDWDGLDWLLGEYPSLPVVLPRVGQAVDRLLFPFMERHQNLRLETSYYLGTGALERACDRFGPGRFLFGTGMPRFAPGPAITLLTYSGLAADAKQAIAGDNLRHLLAAVDPVTKLLPIEPIRRQRKLGTAAGQVWMADDFDEMSEEELAPLEGADDQ